MDLCFFHGLDSSPLGTKSRLLKKHYPECKIPVLPPDIHTRLALVEQEIKQPILVVGSSLGGLTALMFAERHPELTAAMLLMAPAVGCREESLFTEEQKKVLESVYIPAKTPTIIIAGVKDEVIPLASIRAMVARSPHPQKIQLNEVDDDHNLHNSLEMMLQAIEFLKTGKGDSL
jgi:pimeloyl-ACP methyl ester carboxylesterase